MDHDATVLEDAARAVMSIDKKYRKADFNGKLDLKKSRNDAFNAYARARLKLLEDGMITTRRDVNAMKAIREEVTRARQTQTLIAGAVKLVRFLKGFA